MKQFQRRYGLEDDGVVGPRTQVALRTVEMPRPRPSARPIHLHRYRRRAMSSGLFSAAAFPEVDERLDEEIEAVEDAVSANGAQTRAEIARQSGAREWGPGRLHQALRAAVQDGRIRKSGRHYEPTGRR